jgi:beta-hydroxylase
MDYKVGKFLRFFMEKGIHLVQPDAVLKSDLFPWAKEIERQHPAIKSEVEKVLEFLPAIVNFNDVIPGQRALTQNQLWKSYFLVGLGEPVPGHQSQCPETSRALKEIPGIINAFFSILTPGTVIPPHRGPYAGILRYHLGVIIPKGDIAIKVNYKIHKWSEGRSLFFDDSFVHEAWNRTDSIRVILFVDFERPLPFQRGPRSTGNGFWNSSSDSKLTSRTL